MATARPAVKKRRMDLIAVRVLNGMGGVLFFGGLFVGRLNLPWMLLCLAAAAGTMVLCLRYPKRFTMLSQKAYRKCGAHEKLGHLDLAVLMEYTVYLGEKE